MASTSSKGLAEVKTGSHVRILRWEIIYMLIFQINQFSYYIHTIHTDRIMHPQARELFK